MQEVVARGVPCFSGSCPEVYNEKAVVTAGFAPEQPLSVAHELGKTSLMLLVHPTMLESHRERTVEAVREVMALAVT